MNRKILITLLAIISLAADIMAQDIPLLVGTYTGAGKGEGIYLYNFNLATGDAKLRNTVKGITNPSYLTVSADNKFIYSVNEDGGNSGASAFAYDRAGGNVKLLNSIKITGKDPCYIISDNDNVITANYSSGDITVFERKADGKLGSVKQVAQHYGPTGPNKARQEAPHAHMVFFSPDKKFMLANDLGNDKIYVYAYDAKAKQPLTLKDSVQVQPGAGPRHLTFSPNGKNVFVIGELDGHIYSYKYKAGKLSFNQRIYLLHPSQKPQKFDGADIHFSPDGKLLYATLRGDLNSITRLAIDARDKLFFRDNRSTQGVGPRNFTITPDGNWLLVAHQRSNNIVVFKRDQTTGELTDTGKRIEVGAPVCLVFN